MRYTPLEQKYYVENRRRFTSKLPKNSLAVFNSNDIMPTNADGTMPFRQNNDLLYLSGIDQEESVLLIFPDAFDPNMREILFLKETNPEIAIWEGEKYTKSRAQELSGIKNIQWLDKLQTFLTTLMPQAENVYLNSNEHTRAVVEVETRDERFRKKLQIDYPLHQYRRSAPLMHRLRSVKSEGEIALMQEACNITEKGFRRVLNFIKPGVMEYEIEAEYAHEFLRNRSRGFAYTPIVASGFNACVLHYVENNKPCKDGDMLLMDVGSEYANYSSDMTRSVPVNGRFTKRQREVYEAVLRVMKEATKLLQPGVYLSDYHKEVGSLMEKELVDLGLLTMEEINRQDAAWPAYKKYFMHGTSHFIGLDTHDVGLWTEPIQEGNVFTVEPGIYIREESLGIRLENNFVIGEKENFDLMRNIPIEPDEIEDLMNR